MQIPEFTNNRATVMKISNVLSREVNYNTRTKTTTSWTGSPGKKRYISNKLKLSSLNLTIALSSNSKRHGWETNCARQSR